VTARAAALTILDSEAGGELLKELEKLVTEGDDLKNEKVLRK